MKLELSLPERPGLLHAIPVCDLLVIVWLMFLLGDALVRQSGVAIELPPSQFQLGRFQQTEVITLGPGEQDASIHFGRDVVTMGQLVERLDRLRADGAQASLVILLRTDAGTAVGMERKVVETVLDKGFRVALIGSRELPSMETDSPSPSRE